MSEPEECVVSQRMLITSAVLIGGILLIATSVVSILREPDPSPLLGRERHVAADE